MDRKAASCAPCLQVSVDDNQVDYNSLLEEEERRRRFSEVLDDENLNESIRLEKKLRQIQRKIYFRNQIMAGVGECMVLSCKKKTYYFPLYYYLEISQHYLESKPCRHNPCLPKKGLNDTKVKTVSIARYG